MKIAIVHDYIKEYGGAERVLEVLLDIYPQADLYTAFCDRSSTAYDHFKNRKITTSWFNNLPFYSKLASPLRFLTPLIWRSFDFKDYDLVISSASWYITKGFKKQNDKFIEVCYCHTPPRWLYGYETSVNFKKLILIRIYALIVGHFLRIYDFKSSQKVDYFIANSEEVRKRINKFYKKDAVVIYPPVSLPKINDARKENYYFIVSRIVGSKGIEIAVDAALKMGFKLKIAGSSAGYYSEVNSLIEKSKGKVEFLGQVSDKELAMLYKKARAFLALAKDEDFGITPVEAMFSGTPVIAFNGGGFKETVVNGKTGILFDDYSADGLINAIKEFEKANFKSKDCEEQAQNFSKQVFSKKIKDFIASKS